MSARFFLIIVIFLSLDSCFFEKKGNLCLKFKNFGFDNGIYCDSIFLIKAGSNDTIIALPTFDSLIFRDLPYGKYYIGYYNIFKSKRTDSINLQNHFEEKVLFLDHYLKGKTNLTLKKILSNDKDSITIFIDLGLEKISEKLILKQKNNQHLYSFLQDDIFIIKNKTVDGRKLAILDSLFYEFEQINKQKRYCSEIYHYYIVNQLDTIKIQDGTCRWRGFGKVYSAFKSE